MTPNPLYHERFLEDICEYCGYTSEVKYSSTNQASLSVRRGFINYFASSDDLQFQCIIKARSAYDLSHYRAHDGQGVTARALAYNHTYKQLFLHKLRHCARVMAYIDDRSRTQGDNLPEYLLREVSVLSDVQPVESKRFRLLQMADLLTGLHYGLLKGDAAGVKRELQEQFRETLGVHDVTANSWSLKCGRWNWRPNK